MPTIYNNGTAAADTNVVNSAYGAIDRIFKSDIRAALALNSLNGFNKGSVENGRILEEMFIEMATPYNFERGSTTKYFTAEDAKIHTKYYGDWNERQTSKEWYNYKIREMLDAGKSVDEVAQQIVVSVASGDEDLIYNDLKGLLANAKASMTPFAMNATPTNLEDLLLTIRNAVSHFRYVNNDYCAYKSKTPADNIRVIISSYLINQIDVVKLANTLNIDRAEIRNLFWEVDTTDNVVYIVDINAIGYFEKNFDAYTEVKRPLRKMITYLDHDVLYYYCDFFKATYITYTPAQTNADSNSEAESH